MPRVPRSREAKAAAKSPSWGSRDQRPTPSVRLRPAAAQGENFAALVHRSSTTHSCATRDSPFAYPVPAGCCRAPCRGRSLGHGRSACSFRGDRRRRQQPARAKRRLRCAGNGYGRRNGRRILRSANRGGSDRLRESSRRLPRGSRQARPCSRALRRETECDRREARSSATGALGVGSRLGNVCDR